MIRKLLPYTRGYRRWIFAGILCSAAESVLELMLPNAMSDIVNVGIAGGDRSYILASGLKMLVMALLALSGGVGAALLAAKAGMGFGAQLRQAEYEQVQRFSFANIERFSTASLITRLTTVRISLLPSLVLVWPSNWGSVSLTEMTHTKPSRTSSPDSLSFSLSMPSRLP